MASQITHIVYGKKIFDRNQLSNWDDFVIGTVFPDIRYLAQIDRDLTHIYDTSEDKIPKDNSFKAGHYVHCLVDEKREEFLDSQDVYELLNATRLTGVALKFVEDEVVYDLFNQWQELQVTFDKVHDDQLILGIKHEDAKKWHGLIKQYISHIPNDDTYKHLAKLMGFPDQIIEALMKEISQIRQNDKVMEIIKATYQNI